MKKTTKGKSKRVFEPGMEDPRAFMAPREVNHAPLKKPTPAQETDDEVRFELLPPSAFTVYGTVEATKNGHVIAHIQPINIRASERGRKLFPNAPKGTKYRIIRNMVTVGYAKDIDGAKAQVLVEVSKEKAVLEDLARSVYEADLVMRGIKPR